MIKKYKKYFLKKFGTLFEKFDDWNLFSIF